VIDAFGKNYEIVNFFGTHIKNWAIAKYFGIQLCNSAIKMYFLHKIRLRNQWSTYFDFTVLTRVLWQFTAKFAPLTRAFRCAPCKQGRDR